MKLHIYHPHELRFAFCYRLYFSWRTHRGNPILLLTRLDRATLNRLLHPYNIRVLECATDETDLRCIVSLRPVETISGCASKLKGRVSKWLNEGLDLDGPVPLLSKGYFACSVGKTRSRAVERYLSLQAEHHGYDRRILPPVFVEEYQLSAEDEARISPKHACVMAKFHLVFSTSGRCGILGSAQARRIASRWLALQQDLHIALIKVSFVPDHVHVALRTHPSVSPADIAAALMNAAQEVVQLEMIQAGMERLWALGAYIGSYGTLSSAQVRKYIENWQSK